MAAKKSQGDSGKNEELANSLLKVAAELLKGSDDSSPSAEKKPAAKKSSTKSATAAKSSSSKKTTTAKKPAAKKSAAKPKEESVAEEPAAEEPTAETKPAAKKSSAKSAPKSTAKKSAPKAEPAKEEEPAAAEVEEPTVSEPAEEPKAEEPAPVEPAEEPKAEEPAPVEATEEPKAEEPAPVEPAEEPKAEEPASVKCASCGKENPIGSKFCAGCGGLLEAKAEPEKTEPASEQQVANEPKQEAAQPAKKKASVAEKAGEIINKKKLPIFIIVNALFLVCTIFFMAVSFNITIDGTGALTKNYSLFDYFGKAAEIKPHLYGAALNWLDGAYGLIGLLMVISMLLPIGLIVKNVIIAVTQKNPDKKFNVYKVDAVIAFAFVLFYMSISSFYGANVAAGQVIALIISMLELAFCIFGEMLDKKGQRFPWFSIGVIALVILSLMFFTNLPVYQNSAGNEWYGASAASASNSGFMFVTYLVAVCALILLVITQLWKLPKLLDIITPAAAAVCALLTLIIGGAGKPSGASMGGFVFGALFMILLAGAYIVFTLVPSLNKLKVRFCDMSSNVQPAPAAEETAATTVKCPSCGKDNSADVKFCYYCGKPLEAAATEAPTSEQPAAEAAATEDTGGLCPRCGTQNDPSAPYCRDCGTKLK